MKNLLQPLGYNLIFFAGINNILYLLVELN